MRQRPETRRRATSGCAIIQPWSFHIPFGDGGLAFVRLTSGRPVPHTRVPPVQASSDDLQPSTDELVDDQWHTAELGPGDTLVFSSETVHRGLPPTNDRIRITLASVASGETDPRPAATFTTLEDLERYQRIRELRGRMYLSEDEILGVRGDLLMTGLPVNETTVRSAATRDPRRLAPARPFV